MTKQQQAKATQLVILVRYYVKKSAVIDNVIYPAGSVVLKVRNYKGVEYTVVLRRNKVHYCSCPHIPSPKCPECYHILVGKAIENARARAARKVAQSLVVVTEVQLLPTPVAELHQEIDAYLAKERKEAEIHATAKRDTQAMERRMRTAGLMR